jgi:hypothetical protein
MSLFPLRSLGTLGCQARSKRFLSQIANLVTFHLFPVPVLPSNFIGLQVLERAGLSRPTIRNCH